MLSTYTSQLSLTITQVDYLFNPKSASSTTARHSLVQNLRHGAFNWTGWSVEDVHSGIEYGDQVDPQSNSHSNSHLDLLKSTSPRRTRIAQMKIARCLGKASNPHKSHYNRKVGKRCPTSTQLVCLPRTGRPGLEMHGP